MIQELFTPPTGMIKSIPANKQEDYRKKYAALGPFTKHEYDMDICVMYRQMDELKSRYKDFNGAPFENYVTQIRDNMGMTLGDMKLDKEFYLDNFYYVIKSDNRFYFSYLGLFLALSDPLKVIPILEYHLKEFLLYDKEKLGAEHFLGKLEYLVCNFLRTNRFPEDFYAKHDKIINWIYSKKTLHENQIRIDAKLEALLTAVNKVTPKNIPNIVLKDKNNSQGTRKSHAVVIAHERVEVLYEDIKEYFSKASYKELKTILKGKAQPDSKIIFIGHANQLCDVFRIYSKDGHMTGTKRSIATWICDHFMYYIDSTQTPEFFDQQAVENVLYGQDLPPKGPKRIKLSALKQEQHLYYPKK